jgi:hypothetical protein
MDPCPNFEKVSQQAIAVAPMLVRQERYRKSGGWINRKEFETKKNLTTFCCAANSLAFARRQQAPQKNAAPALREDGAFIEP